MSKLPFVDAQNMHHSFPDTFEVPSAEDLDAIRPEWHVKISTGGERFWVRVGMVTGEKIGGMVTSRLVATAVHGLKRNDVVHFEKCHIHAVVPPGVKKP